ncbi:MAG: PAS domain-containing protein [Erythrobacter sp.]|uniref:PAS domain-containing protein n=1 Tax=Erythrobacter sp. TaxID=1042 RepID=UPI0025F76F31|nr:PAS domain-containing protein [Erythrobacter sp.]MCL9999499.1 PAS domain-containing protein [Erythrobacter sp.]
MADFSPQTDDSLFGAAFGALPDAVCILEPIGVPGESVTDWRYLAANPVMCELLAIEDPTGATLRDRFPHLADHWAPDFERAILGTAPEVLVREAKERPEVYEVVLCPLHYSGRRAIMARMRNITTEHQARALQREADARYKLLFDAIDEGFCVIEVQFDAENRPIDYLFIEGNDAFLDQSGLTDPIGKTMRTLQPDIEDKWVATYGRIAMTGVAERFESESQAMNRWFDVFAFPIGETAPHRLGILFEDIGKRKTMELALRHSENRLHSLIEATSDLIFRMNPEGTVMEQLGGKSLLGEATGPGDWIEEFVTPSDRVMVRDAVDTAIAAQQPIDVEHRYLRPDGSVGWLYSRAVPVFDEQRTITEWFGMSTDITNRRLAERELAHGAQMLRVASEIGKVGLWDWNVESGEIHWSDEHYRMEGYEPGEVVPSYELWAERVHPDDREIAVARLAEAMESGQDYISEYRVCHPDGEVVWLSARGRFLYDEQGKPVRMLGAMVDMTQRRREEEWQRLLVAELQHRVRNLIGMVRSVARLSAPSHRHVDEYVDHLIGRLQAMGRTQSTLTRSPGRSVDLAELVREELLVHAVQDDKCHVEGPEIALSPHAAEIVTLAIHELATNSVKYGALGDTGYIRIVWDAEQRGEKYWVILRWQETAPVRKAKQNRKGFGRKLIEERVPYELQGEGRFTVHDTGVLAVLEFPLVDAGSILDPRS